MRGHPALIKRKQNKGSRTSRIISLDFKSHLSLCRLCPSQHSPALGMPLASLQNPCPCGTAPSDRHTGTEQGTCLPGWRPKQLSCLILNKNINCSAPLQKNHASFLHAVNKISLLRALLLILNSFAALSLVGKKPPQLASLRFLSYSVNSLIEFLIEISISWQHHMRITGLHLFHESFHNFLKPQSHSCCW